MNRPILHNKTIVNKENRVHKSSKPKSLTEIPIQRKLKIGDKVRLKKDWDSWPDEMVGIVDSIDREGSKITIKDSAFIYRINNINSSPKFIIEFLDESEYDYYINGYSDD